MLHPPSESSSQLLLWLITPTGCTGSSFQLYICCLHVVWFLILFFDGGNMALLISNDQKQYLNMDTIK